MKKIRFTKEGYEDFLKQKQLLEEQRIKAVNDLSVARDMGDRSENAAYKSARQKLSGIDRQLRFINSQLRFAEVVEPRTDGIIDIGAKVQVDDGNGIKDYVIVGNNESDLSKGRVSQFSPLGKALIGKKAGDIINLNAPVGVLTLHIKKVSDDGY